MFSLHIIKWYLFILSLYIYYLFTHIISSHHLSIYMSLHIISLYICLFTSSLSIYMSLHIISVYIYYLFTHIMYSYYLFTHPLVKFYSNIKRTQCSNKSVYIKYICVYIYIMCIYFTHLSTDSLDNLFTCKQEAMQ